MTDFYEINGRPVNNELRTEFETWMNQYMGRLSWETSITYENVLELMVYEEDGTPMTANEIRLIEAWFDNRSIIRYNPNVSVQAGA